jgi:hypothetical protein
LVHSYVADKGERHAKSLALAAPYGKMPADSRGFPFTDLMSKVPVSKKGWS